jgi:hypothetical protein
MLLPPVHIKFGLMKNSVKAPDRNGPAFSFFCDKFQRLSIEQIKAGVFIGPQICELFRDPQFDFVFSVDKKAAWSAFRHVTVGFLGNVKAVNFSKLVDDLITSYKKLGCNMSLTMHFLHSHLESFRLIVVP